MQEKLLSEEINIYFPIFLIFSFNTSQGTFFGRQLFFLLVKICLSPFLRRNPFGFSVEDGMQLTVIYLVLKRQGCELTGNSQGSYTGTWGEAFLPRI